MCPLPRPLLEFAVSRRHRSQETSFDVRGYLRVEEDTGAEAQPGSAAPWVRALRDRPLDDRPC